MTGWRATWVVARVWGARPIGLALVGMGALAALWQGRLAVPMRRDVAELVWPLAPLLLGFTVPSAAARAWTAEERVAPRSGWLRRLTFVGAVSGVAVVACASLTLLHPFSVLARNAALLVGVGLAGAVLLPASLRWFPPVMVPIAMWLWGARSAGEPAAAWAVLLHRSGSFPALWVAAACFVTGVVLYVLLPRPLAD